MQEMPKRSRIDGAFEKVRAHMLKRKPKGPTARRRAAKRRRLDKAELVEMNHVRERDGHCRFLFCPCRIYGAMPQVSHQKHRGMGGNPSLDRTDRRTMLLLCPWRHTGSRLSNDQRGISWVPISPDKGAEGPVIWILDTAALPNDDAHFWIRRMARGDGTVIIAAEIQPHEYYPIQDAFPLTWRLIEWLTDEAARGYAK